MSIIYLKKKRWCSLASSKLLLQLRILIINSKLLLLSIGLLFRMRSWVVQHLHIQPYENLWRDWYIGWSHILLRVEPKEKENEMLMIYSNCVVWTMGCLWMFPTVWQSIWERGRLGRRGRVWFVEVSSSKHWLRTWGYW